jgi:hypothetical protein
MVDVFKVSLTKARVNANVIKLFTDVSYAFLL